MTKKKNTDDYTTFENLIKEALPYMPTSTISPIPLQKETGNRLIDAENAGKQAETVRYIQDMTDMRQLTWQLYLNIRDTRAEINELKNLLHTVEKNTQHHEKALEHFGTKLKKLSKCTKELRMLNNKLKKKSEKLSEKIKHIHHIIACISSLFGGSSMSDSLKTMAHNWSKETKRLQKKHKFPNCEVIEGTYREVD